MPQILPAVATAISSAYASSIGFLAAPLVGVLGEGGAIALVSGIVKGAGFAALSATAGVLLQPKVGGSGPVGEFKTDPTAPIRGVMGRYAIGGNKIFKRLWGRTNVYKTFVALLSLGPCLSIDGFKAGPLAVNFNQASQGVATGKYAGHMWMTYRMGLPGAAALAPPSGVFIENPKLTAWTSAHKADGHVTAMWTLAQAEDVQKRDLYTQGEPDALWTGRWMKVHDPRLDSTYPGGSGPQRRDEWDTWEWTENPYLHALAWIRGHAKLNDDGTVDRSLRIAGVGAPERAIDVAAFVEGANVADANGWKIAGEWSTADDKWQVLAAMLQAGGGVPLNRGAQISCMVSTPRASIYTYTRNDLVGGATVKAMKPRRDRKNTIIPRYRSEAHDWEVVPAGAVSSSVYVTEDRGEPRSLEIEYSYVPAAKQAGELGAYDLANMREGLETSLPSKPHLLGLRAGDAFVADVPELGLVDQKFIVQRRAFDPQTGVVTLDVLSETDGKHAWALGQAANPPPSPSLEGIDPDYVTPPELPEWTVIVRPPGAGGTQQPGFTIIGGSANAQASSVVMEHGPTSTGPWKQFYDGALKTTEQVNIDGLDPGEVYYVAVRYRRDENAAESDRYIYGPYTAPPLVSSDTANLNGEPASQVVGRLADAETLAAVTSGRVDDLEVVVSDAEGDFATALVLAEQYADASEAAAVASDASATSAATQAGQALTYSGQAADARDDAVLARIGAETAATTADGAAATAVAQASQASGDAASASLSAQVAASLGTGGGFHLDPTFQQWPAGSTLPNNVTTTGSTGALTVNRLTSGVIYGDKALQVVQTGGDVAIRRINLGPGRLGPPTRDVIWVLDYQIRLDAGTFTGASWYVQTVYDTGYRGAYVGLLAQHGPGVVGDVVRGQVFVRGLYGSFSGNPVRNEASLFVQGPALPGNGSNGAKTLTVMSFNWRPATAAEIEANEAIPALEAAVAVNTGAVIDLEAQVQNAFFEVIAAAGGDPAQLLMKAGSGTSLIALAASSIVLKTVSGGALVEALKLIGGEAYFGAPVSVTVSSRRLTIGPGFGTSNQCVLWFGPSTTAIGSMTRTNGYFALGTDGKVYLGTAELGQNTPKVTSMTFSGNAGYSGGAGVPVNTAGTTPAMTVPQTGKIVVDVSNVFALSEGNGSSDLAIGSLDLQIGKNGTYTTLVSGVAASTSSAVAPGAPVNAQAMNVEVVHNFAGPVTFRVRATGGGASTNSRSVISGSLRATHYAD